MSETVEPVDMSGRARVRHVLMEPLERAGLERRGRMTVADHEAMKERLVAEFAHMQEATLQAVRDLVFRHADGKRGLSWPPEALLRKWGLKLQPKPPRKNPYVATLLASAMGQRALQGGYLTELFFVALQLGPPPTRYDVSRMQAKARDAARDIARIDQLQKEGRASPEDLEWVERYRRGQAIALDMASKGQGNDSETICSQAG